MASISKLSASDINNIQKILSPYRTGIHLVFIRKLEAFTDGERVKKEEYSHNWVALLEKYCIIWSHFKSRGRGGWQWLNWLGILKTRKILQQFEIGLQLSLLFKTFLYAYLHVYIDKDNISLRWNLILRFWILPWSTRTSVPFCCFFLRLM